MDASLIGLVAAALFGAIVGSFLNVVIYRLPLGLSVGNPAWSFCPICRTRIKPRHNIPIIGWLMLRGQCRYCSGPIAAMYPIVECACALMFIAIYDAFFISHVVPGVSEIAGGWALGLGVIVLMCCLLAGAVMDFEYYIVDIRLCIFAIVVGSICRGVQGLPSLEAQSAKDAVRGLLPPSLAGAALLMGAAWLATIGIAACFPRRGRAGDANESLAPADSESDQAVSTSSEDVEQTAEAALSATLPTEETRPNFQPRPLLTLCLATSVVFGASIWLSPTATIGGVGVVPAKGVAITLVFLIVLIMASLIHRESDTEVIDAIEAERKTARSQALSEFRWLAPALVVGVGGFLFFRQRGWAAVDWDEALASLGMAESWGMHASAAAQAVAAGTLAAAMGWAVRILGTLTFGKEAFGTGDIYIMAAIGAAAGFWIMFFAFFLAALLALVGVLATAFAKSSRALPFGPWLALGTFVAFWFQTPLLRFCSPAGSLFWSFLCGVKSWLV